MKKIKTITKAELAEKRRLAYAGKNLKIDRFNRYDYSDYANIDMIPLDSARIRALNSIIRTDLNRLGYQLYHSLDRENILSAYEIKRKLYEKLFTIYGSAPGRINFLHEYRSIVSPYCN